MINSFFATKLETSQIFDIKGNLQVVTKLKITPLTVAQLKSKAKNGYDSIQFTLPKTVKKLWRREIKLTEVETVKVGDQINLADILKVGDKLKVTGTSKGKGFAGVVKRHGFAGVGGQTHGQSDRQRAPGSIGMRTTPGRVWKGHRMAGHMGSETVSIRNLIVLAFDEITQILTVSGTIPGSRKSLIKLTKTNGQN